MCLTCIKASVLLHGIVSFSPKWDYNRSKFSVNLSILLVLALYCIKKDAYVVFVNNVNKLKLLPILLCDSCGELKNSGNYSCFLIHTALAYTLGSNINYCERTTAGAVENFAVIFNIATAAVSYK